MSGVVGAQGDWGLVLSNGPTTAHPEFVEGLSIIPSLYLQSSQARRRKDKLTPNELGKIPNPILNTEKSGIVPKNHPTACDA